MKYAKLDPATLQALYDEWAQSGEPQRAFLKRKGLTFSVFNNNYGVIKSSKFKAKPAKPSLLPVHVAHMPVQASPMASKLLVQLPSGTSLHFTTDVPAQYIGSLLSVMESRPTC